MLRIIKQLDYAIENIDTLEAKRKAVKVSIIDKQFVWQENAKRIVELYKIKNHEIKR